MSQKNYITISGIIFAAVSVLHLVRFFQGWEFMIGSMSVPAWGSIGAFIVTGFLAFSAFKLSR